MNDRRLARLLSDAVELLDRSQLVLAARLADMADARNGWPASSSLDSAGGRSKTTFCEVHQRERCDCGEGTPYANLSDPTGEAAIRPDSAAVDRARLEAALRSIGRQAEDVVNLLARWTPRPASDSERQSTLSDNERDASCWSCARTEVSKGVARWEPVSRSADVAGERRELCRWCSDWLRSTGELPAVATVELHHRGVRVRRPA